MISRRQLGRLLLAVLLTPAAGSMALTREMLPLDLDDAAFIGRRFLATHPQWNSVARLIAVVMTDGDVDAAPLATRLAEDFACGRTVIVDGWILPLTEACVCALVEIGQQHAGCASVLERTEPE
jgi:hypothetical protein